MASETGMVMISWNEYEKLKKEKERFEILASAVAKILKKRRETKTTDLELTRKEFNELYEASVFKDDFEINEDLVYGRDVTIHWNGFYCNCEDGATAYNHIICGLKGVIDELDDED